MADVILFHHAQGCTSGVKEFADELRTAGHRVTVPDLYEGQTFATLDEGIAHAKETGFETLIERGCRAADGMPNEMVYAGFSLGVLPAQLLAQTRPGARGALLLYSCVPPSEFGTEWPNGVPLQIHAMEHDEFFAEDRSAADDLVNRAGAELFLYPGEQHLFADSSLPGFDKSAATLLTQRVLSFLSAIG